MKSGHQRSIDALCRCHADACRRGDRDLAKLLVSMIARHCRQMEDEHEAPR